MNTLQQLLIKLGQLLGLLQKAEAEQPTPAPISIQSTPQPIHVSLIPSLAKGIFVAEGNGKQAGMALNNPGDLKFTDYTKSLGAISAGANNFAVFRTMEEGQQACIQLCTDTALGLLKGYPPHCTINQFCEIYAQPPVLSEYVSKALLYCPQKVGTDILSTFL